MVNQSVANVGMEREQVQAVGRVFRSSASCLWPRRTLTATNLNKTACFGTTCCLVRRTDSRSGVPAGSRTSEWIPSTDPLAKELRGASSD